MTLKPFLVAVGGDRIPLLRMSVFRGPRESIISRQSDMLKSEPLMEQGQNLSPSQAATNKELNVSMNCKGISLRRLRCMNDLTNHDSTFGDFKSWMACGNAISHMTRNPGHEFKLVWTLRVSMYRPAWRYFWSIFLSDLFVSDDALSRDGCLSDPITYRDTMLRPDTNEWHKTLNDEMCPASRSNERSFHSRHFYRVFKPKLDPCTGTIL